MGRRYELRQSPEDGGYEERLSVEDITDKAEEGGVQPFFEITRHLAEARETIPDLGDDGLPDLGLCSFPSLVRGHLAPEDALGERAEVRGEEGE